MRYVNLLEEEKQELEGLYKTSNNHVTRERCLCLLLSSKKHSMIEVSRLTNIDIQKITRLFNAWESSLDKFSTLSIAPGRGAVVKLRSVRELLPDMLKNHERNLIPVLHELQVKYNISVCKLTLQNFLKEYRI